MFARRTGLRASVLGAPNTNVCSHERVFALGLHLRLWNRLVRVVQYPYHQRKGTEVNKHLPTHLQEQSLPERQVRALCAEHGFIISELTANGKSVNIISRTTNEEVSVVWYKHTYADKWGTKAEVQQGWAGALCDVLTEVQHNKKVEAK